MIFKALLALLGFGLIIGGFFFMRRDESKPKAGGPIVFFGNSITFGVGTNPGEDFVTIVGRELAVEVVNAGVSGDTTADALKRVESDVLSKKPAIVVIELGGNDFLGKVDFEETKRNYKEIVSKIKPSRALIVIASVNPIIDQRYEDFLKNLASENKAVFVPNILKGVIGDPKLMADRIHPNGEGHKKIAKKLVRVLKPLTVK